MMIFGGKEIVCTHGVKCEREKVKKFGILEMWVRKLEYDCIIKRM